MGVVALVGLGLATPAYALSDLVLTSQSLPGYRAAKISAGSLRSQLSATLARGQRSRLARAEAQAAAARKGRQLLRSGAFELRSARDASAIVRAWGRAHRAKRAAVGAGGFALARGNRATVVWRQRNRVGLLAFAGSGDATATAIDYARLADTRLRAPEPATAFDRLMRRVRRDGTLPKSAALQLVALAYGPIPGVKRPPGRRGGYDGTVVVDSILRYRDSLPRRQRQAVDRALGFGPPAGARSARARAPANVFGRGFRRNAALEQKAEGFAARYAQTLGPLVLKLVVGTSRVLDDPDAIADTISADAAGNVAAGRRPTQCVIRAHPDAVAADADAVLAHEVFHCFQERIMNGNRGGQAVWVIEGSATWGQQKLVPRDYQSPLREYIQNPGREVGARSYDAVGIFGHAEDVFGSIWSRLPDVIRAQRVDAPFEKLGGTQDAFLTSWGSSVFRLSGGTFGREWTMTNPLAPPAFGALLPGGMGTVVGRGQVGVPRYATAQYTVDAGGAPLLHFTIQGKARLGDGTNPNYTDLRDAWFCTTGRCECPPRTEGRLPQTQPLAATSRLGLSGDPSAITGGGIESKHYSDFCRPREEERRPSSGCGVGVIGARSAIPVAEAAGAASGASCGTTNGDPHLRTFDGERYDFQAAGEFTLARSTAGDFEVQVRQEPFPRSRFVSINTAIAMRVGGAIVEVDKGTPLIVRVDRRREKLARNALRLLRGGGSVTFDGRDVTVAWPDGSHARVWPVGEWGVALALKPAPDRTGNLRGLLGNRNNGRDDDFVGRDGRRYPRRLITGQSRASEKALYDEFGPSWLIRQADSLFVYPRGRTTRSYYPEDFPARLFFAKDLSGANRREAERTCRAAGVTANPFLEDCVLDVGLTRDRAFATATAREVDQFRPNATAWQNLASGPSRSSIAIASLAADRATIAAAFVRDIDGNVDVASFRPTAAEIGPVAHATPFVGFTQLGDPLLFPRPEGGLQIIGSGFHSTETSDPLNGTVIAQRSADGSFGAPARIANSFGSTVAKGAVLAGDGQPLWTSGFGGGLYVNHGSGTVTTTDLSAQSPGTVYAPTLGHDGAGRLWLAWYASAGDAARTGLYVLQLDPLTGNVAPGAAPQLAPRSASIANNLLRTPLVCGQNVPPGLRRHRGPVAAGLVGAGRAEPHRRARAHAERPRRVRADRRVRRGRPALDGVARRQPRPRLRKARGRPRRRRRAHRARAPERFLVPLHELCPGRPGGRRRRDQLGEHQRVRDVRDGGPRLRRAAGRAYDP